MNPYKRFSRETIKLGMMLLDLPAPPSKADIARAKKIISALPPERKKQQGEK